MKREEIIRELEIIFYYNFNDERIRLKKFTINGNYAIETSKL